MILEKVYNTLITNNMENKYYTPEIEEFCEGFQYEKRVNAIGEKVEAYFAVDGKIVKVPDYVCTEEDWAGKEFSLSNSKEQDIEKLLEEGRLRVEYLDRKDIESLGFKFSGKAIDMWFVKEGSFEIGGWTFYQINLQYDLDDKRLCIYVVDSDETYPLFKGTVKNKFELKRVLKMLNILE